LEHCKLEDLKGGEAVENVSILEAFLEGRANPGLTGTLYLNAGAGLWVMRKADSLKEGVGLARELVEGGAVKQWVETAKTFFRDRGGENQ
jgi:anthranilate phosphoribosyltransferase